MSYHALAVRPAPIMRIPALALRPVPAPIALGLWPEYVLYPVPGIENFTNAERYKLIQVAHNVGANPELLAATISIESRFNPQARNPYSSATGLIQWMEGTAQAIHGISTKDIYRMNACQQLDLVEAYYRKVAPGGIRVPGDEYIAVAGGKLGASNSTIVYPAGSKAAAANPGWDLNKDGSITLGEIRNLAIARAAAAHSKPPIRVTPERCGGSPAWMYAVGAAAVVGGAAALYAGLKRAA